MLKRLRSTFSLDTTANKLLRLDWIEALQTPGCALCHIGQHKSQRYVEMLLNEAVSDVDRRDTLAGGPRAVSLARLDGDRDTSQRREFSDSLC